MENNLSKKEFEMANTAVESILSVSVESIELSENIPILDDIPDSNKVFKGKLSVLFVDMRKSTDLTDEIKSKKMVKVYRSFIRLVIQAIRYSGGYCRQFAGDGVMGVFQDTNQDENTVSSEIQAIRAARYIITLIDYCLNPLLKKNMDITISCGVGICTGTVMIAKVGMRGREGDNTAENELGIVWVGSTTNYASRFCSLAQADEIFVDETTFKAIEEDKDIWTKTTRVKVDRAYKGYLTSEYYLNIDKEIEIQAIKGEDRIDDVRTFVQEIFQETKEETLKLVGNLSKKYSELEIKLKESTIKEEKLKEKEKELLKKENYLIQLEKELKQRKNVLQSWEKRNQNNEYDLNISIIKTAHCKTDFVKAMGKDFWEKQLNLVVLLGSNIGKSETDVKKEICYALVSIYEDLQMWYEAYCILCIQAEYYTWIYAFTVEKIVSKSKMWSSLKGIINERLQVALLPDIREQLQECLDTLKRMGY